MASTLALFEPCLTEGVDGVFASLNLEFLENYVGISMPERVNAPEVMQIDQETVRSGDSFHIMRYQINWNVSKIHVNPLSLFIEHLFYRTP